MSTVTIHLYFEEDRSPLPGFPAWPDAYRISVVRSDGRPMSRQEAEAAVLVFVEKHMGVGIEEVAANV